MSASARPHLLVLVLAGLLASGCSDPAVIPPDTRLTASLTGELDPAAASPGDTVTARLAGNLQAGDRVLLEKGTPIHGTVTAVQESEGRWPTVVNLAFTGLEVAGERHDLVSRVESVEARVRGEETAGAEGLIGDVARGRAGASLVQPEIQQEAGTSVVLGTEAEDGYLPEGARIELLVLERLEVPPPDA